MTTNREHVVAACNTFDEMATACEERARTWDDATKARQYQTLAARIRAEVRDVRFALSNGHRTRGLGRRLLKLRNWMVRKQEKQGLLTDEDRAEEARELKRLGIS